MKVFETGVVQLLTALIGNLALACCVAQNGDPALFRHGMQWAEILIDMINHPQGLPL